MERIYHFQCCRNDSWENCDRMLWMLGKCRKSHPCGNIAKIYIERKREKERSKTAHLDEKTQLQVLATPDMSAGDERGGERKNVRAQSRGKRAVPWIFKGGWMLRFQLRALLPSNQNVWRFQRAHKRHRFFIFSFQFIQTLVILQLAFFFFFLFFAVVYKTRL